MGKLFIITIITILNNQICLTCPPANANGQMPAEISYVGQHHNQLNNATIEKQETMYENLLHQMHTVSTLQILMIIIFVLIIGSIIFATYMLDRNSIVNTGTNQKKEEDENKRTGLFSSSIVEV